MTQVGENLKSGRAGVTRRNVLRVGAVGVAAVGLGAGKVLMQPSLQARGLLSKDGVFEGASIAFADSLYDEVFPISPLILNPFNDQLPIPPAAKPLTPAEVAALPLPPGPGVGQQNSLRNETHQLWPRRHRVPGSDRLQVRPARPRPLVHHVAGAADQRAGPAGPVVRLGR